MIQQTTAPTERRIERVYCEDTGKLIATIDETGIRVYCLYMRKPELVSKEKCMAVWGSPEQIACAESERPDLVV